MITIFSTPKPFKGHINVIQRNALKSWTLLHPDVEVILFGNDEGAAQACAEFGVRHEAEIRVHEKGPKYLDFIFERAQKIARHEVLCYVNCDIILMEDFQKAVEQLANCRRPFLMVGHRWDADITESLNFSRPDWQEQLSAIVAKRGTMRSEFFIDYFAFTRRLYQCLPPLLIGRVGWDNFLIWKARSVGAMVVDASAVAKAIHQNHDYSYHPDGEVGVWNDELAKRNYELAGGWDHIFSLEHAQYRLGNRGPKWTSRYVAVESRAYWRKRVHDFWSVWFVMLGITRPLRHALGLRQKRAVENTTKPT